MIAYIVIVTYNGEQWIRDTLNSCLKQTVENVVLVVDNASDDSTKLIIEEDFKEVKLISLQQNFGFGKSNNIGIEIALGKGADYVFLLNQDAIIEPKVLEQMINLQKQNTIYGILSPIHFNGSGNALDRYFSVYINEASCPGLLSDLFIREKKLKAVYPIAFVNAAMWLISRECLQKVGGFNPLFAHYGEDRDYIHRLKYHGLKAGVVPDVFGYHDREFNGAKSKSVAYLLNRKYHATLAKYSDVNIKLPGRFYFLGRLVLYGFMAILKRFNTYSVIQFKVFFKLCYQWHAIMLNRRKAIKGDAPFLRVDEKKSFNEE